MRNNSAKRINERNKRREALIIKEMKSFEERLVLLEQGINKPRGLEKYKIYLDVVFGLFIVTVISIVGLSINRAANEIANTANAIAIANLNLQLEQHQIMLEDRMPTFVITHDESSFNEFIIQMRTLEIGNIGGDIYDASLEVRSVLPVNVYKQVGEQEEVFTFALILDNRIIQYDHVNRVFEYSENIDFGRLFANSMEWLSDELRSRLGHDIRISADIYSRDYVFITYYDFAMQYRVEFYWLWAGTLRRTEFPLQEHIDNTIFLTTWWWSADLWTTPNWGDINYLESLEQLFFESDLERMVEIIENFFL
ncbi:MAG: hypothetical protein FWD82_06890 [Defluviitaleaceae bacterium]|nr:hypothetical protein [Defluviitaleaceae bacterium]